MAIAEAPGQRTAEVLREPLRLERYFTKAGVHPYDQIEWELRDAVIPGEKGPVFEQKGVEVPKFWSQTATNVVASKYFRGKLGTPARETSVRQMIDRVAKTIASWGRAGRYFASDDDAQIFEEELTWLLVNQHMAFNSPVWFNVGASGDRAPQCSACFILSVEDDMESILEWFQTEGRIFKGGSGSGLNVSTLRSSKEHLSGGGLASGPVSFMRGADSVAGSIKSGGTTRRAAKMVILNADHPDLREFIWCKAKEERKAWALGEAGYDMSLNGEAWASIQFQNANNSVRATDEFMHSALDASDWTLKAVTTGETLETVKARAILREIAEAAWECGDPGMQFDTTFNDWHTIPESGRINATNPCSEYASTDNSACNLASLNLMRFLGSDGDFDVEGFRRAVRVTFTAQEILVGKSSYPTTKIERNAKAQRQIGLGYANLGALLMQRGLPYDSGEGRAYAAAVSALMTGEAYAQSARIAANPEIGPFEDYTKSRESMLRVIGKHREVAYQIREAHVPASLLSAARAAWDDAFTLGGSHGFRNAQATVLAPTGCLVGDSLVTTSRGLVRLRSLGDTEGPSWQRLDVEVATDEGPRRAMQFFVNGHEAVVSVETSRGYRLQGTSAHRVKVVDPDGLWVWKRIGELKAGDRVPLMQRSLVGQPREVPLPPLGELYWTADHRTRVPRVVTPELAEFVGYFMGDGSLHAKGLRLTVTAADTDVVEHLKALGEELFGVDATAEETNGDFDVCFNSVPLAAWWQACGFAKLRPTPEHRGKGWLPHIPDAILFANDPAVYAAFLRGLFEADGTTSTGYASFTTTYLPFSRDVQTLMLALGFITTRKVDPAIGNWGHNDRYILRLLNVASVTRFLHEVGFISKRKVARLLVGEHRQASRDDHIPVTRAMIDQLAPTNDALRKTMLMSLVRRRDVSRRTATALLERKDDEELERMLGFYYDEITSVEVQEDQATFDLSVPDNLTYVANGFVSHNTISFMMDCDTTGIEPDIALVKYKKLVGGGTLKLVNQTVPAALRRLGYSELQVDAITAYIAAHGTIEGAPELRAEHLAIFDCAFKPQNGTRSISHMGHIKMMGAVQPLISGAISKTVNLPESASVDDVMDAYVEAWKQGVKAIAIYRDGSKKTQPLSTSNADANEKKKAVETVYVEVAKPVRKRLPDTRASLTHKFSIEGHECYITVGLFEDGRPGELFISMAKEGSTLSGMLDAFARSVSLLLQYGAPLSHLVEKFAHMRFEPSGWTGNPEIGLAKSIVDYVFRWIGLRFLSEEEKAYLGLVRETTPVAEPGAQQALLDRAATLLPEATTTNGHSSGSVAAAGAHKYNSTPDAPPCPNCGFLMIRNGTCHKCENCGSTSGCS
jgi:ribonucleoside-diphosphate reductase alpha chain